MKVGFVASSFDLLHPGHILMLKEAKKHCDYLIVGFNTNPENKKNIQSVYERYIQISAVKYVDEIIPYGSENDLYNLLVSNEKSVDVRFLGSDYIGKEYTGQNLNIKIIFIERKHNYSTTELKERIKYEKE